MPFNAKGLLRDAGISLEKAATDKFGQVVDDFVGGAFPSSRRTNEQGVEVVDRTDTSVWYASSYAAALAAPTDYRPKLKFMFRVRFHFTPQAIELLKSVGGLDVERLERNEFTFMIKSVDRPKIDFEYEDEINMYNYRTKVLKKIRHRELTVAFMDDTGNRVFDFFRALMMIHSPITRRQLDRDNSLEKPTGNSIALASGMTFAADKKSLIDAAHRGVVNTNFGNSIESIRVQQVFVDPSQPLDKAAKMVSFDFMNPRIVSFDLDEVSHEQNDINVLTMVFDYDWMEMINIGSLGSDVDYPNTPEVRQSFPIKGAVGAPSDFSPQFPSGVEASQAGASQLSSDLIGRGVRSIAGNNRFAQALGGTLTSAIAGPIGGLVSGAVREGTSGLTATASNAFQTSARAVASRISDSAAGAGAAPRAVVSSSPAVANSNPAPRGG
jgi:hypothetical protein